MSSTTLALSLSFLEMRYVLDVIRSRCVPVLVHLNNPNALCAYKAAKCVLIDVCCACKYVDISAFALHYSSHSLWIWFCHEVYASNWNHCWIISKCPGTQFFYSVRCVLSLSLTVSRSLSSSAPLCHAVPMHLYAYCLLFYLFIGVCLPMFF